MWKWSCGSFWYILAGTVGLLPICSITDSQAKQAGDNLSLQQLPAIASTQTQVQGDISGEVSVLGRRRSYYLHTPSSYEPNKPLPLVVAFHGSSSSGQKMAASTGLSKVAEQKGFLVVYPNAINKNWDIAGDSKTSIDDVAFVTALIEHLTKIRAIDKQRIYATGTSDGGFFVQRLACKIPRQFAAFASVAASLITQIKPYCQSQVPVSVMTINGTADNVVPLSGGAPPKVRIGNNLSILSIPDTIAFWRQHNSCSSIAQIEQLSDNKVEISSYQSCQNGSEVRMVLLKGGGHIWPGDGSGRSQFLDAGTAIWDFFSRHST